MTEDKKEETRVVLVEGKLSKIIHTEGEGESPQKGQEVHALYRGTLETGEEFDSNLNRDSPFTFTIGQGQVIKGWDEGFASMKIGEKATLICSPEYAYGARGSPPKIPPNSTLHFEVELLGFNDKKKEKWDLSDEEKVSEATKLKNEGNDLLKEGQFVNAAKKYEEGIEFVDGEQNEDAKSILKILRMNASQAYIKTKEYQKSIKLATEVLKEDPDNLKTLYRRGVSYSSNQDFDLAKIDIERLITLDPSNTDAKQELVKIAQAKKAVAEKEKKVFGGMFAKSGLYEDKKQSETKEPSAKDEGYEEMPEEEEENGEQQQETPVATTSETDVNQ